MNPSLIRNRVIKKALRLTISARAVYALAGILTSSIFVGCGGEGGGGASSASALFKAPTEIVLESEHVVEANLVGIDVLSPSGTFMLVGLKQGSRGDNFFIAAQLWNVKTGEVKDVPDYSEMFMSDYVDEDKNEVKLVSVDAKPMFVDDTGSVFAMELKAKLTVKGYTKDVPKFVVWNGASERYLLIDELNGKQIENAILSPDAMHAIVVTNQNWSYTAHQLDVASGTLSPSEIDGDAVWSKYRNRYVHTDAGIQPYQYADGVGYRVNVAAGTIDPVAKAFLDKIEAKNMRVRGFLEFPGNLIVFEDAGGEEVAIINAESESMVFQGEGYSRDSSAFPIYGSDGKYVLFCGYYKGYSREKQKEISGIELQLTSQLVEGYQGASHNLPDERVMAMQFTDSNTLALCSYNPAAKKAHLRTFHIK